MLTLLLLPLAAAALTLHGVPVAFSPITRQSRSLSLTLVRSKVHPTDVLLYFGANVFLVPSLDPSRMQGEFAPYTPRMKVAPGLSGDQGLIVRCVNASLQQHMGKAVVLNPRTLFAPGPVHANAISLLAQSSNVLQISAPRRGVHHHALPPLPVRAQFLANPWGPPLGAGVMGMTSDTGLAPQHCSFYQQGYAPPLLPLNMSGAVPAFPPTASKVAGILYFEYLPGVYTDPAPYYNAHGTRVAGVTSAQQCESNEGVAPADQFLFVDMTSTAPNMTLPPSWERVFQVASNLSVQFHSISWGLNSSYGEYDAEAAALDQVAYDYDVVHCVSVGNTGPTGLLYSPATMKNALSVGACLGDFVSVADFSSVGPTNDGRRAPRVVALGVGVNVSVAQASGSDYDSFGTDQGTSLASAGICGLVALFADYYSNTLQAGVAGGSLRLAAILNSARAMSQVVNTTSGMPLPQYHDASWGLPNASAWPSSLYYQGAVAQNQNLNLCFKALAANVSLTLAWMDPPGVPYSSPVLVNNLLLTVSHNGWVYTPSNEVDNVVRIIVTNASAGLPFRVVVRPEGVVAFSPQRYGLALSGLANSSACDPVVNCVVPHGSGELLPSGCLITACDANYMLKNDMCLCNPDVQCGGGVAVFCGNNTFPPCPHNTVIIQYVESATAQAFSIISLIFSTFLLLAFCCYVGCHCRRGKRAHHLQHPFKAKQEDLPHSFFDKYLRRRWAKGNAT